MQYRHAAIDAVSVNRYAPATVESKYVTNAAWCAASHEAVVRRPELRRGEPARLDVVLRLVEVRPVHGAVARSCREPRGDLAVVLAGQHLLRRSLERDRDRLAGVPGGTGPSLGQARV